MASLSTVKENNGSCEVLCTINIVRCFINLNVNSSKSRLFHGL